MPEYLLPDVGEGLTEAEIVSWKVAVGDVIAINDIVCEIETAKSIVELPSPYAGEVTAILAPVGETIAVGTPIITVVEVRGAPAPSLETTPADAPAPPPLEIDLSNPAASGGGEGESLVGRMKADRAPTRRPRTVPSGAIAAHMQAQAAFEPGAAAPLVEAEPDESAVVVPAPSAAAAPRPAAAVGALAKPPVRKLAKDLGVDLATLAGSGPGGVITRGDVEAGAGGGPGARAPEVSRLVASAPRTSTTGVAGAPRTSTTGVAGAPRTSTTGVTGAPRTSTTGVAAGVSAGSTTVGDSAGRETREPVKGVRKMMAGAMVGSAFTAPHVTEWVTVDATRTMELVERLKARREFREVRVSPLLVLARAAILAMRRTPEINSTWDEAAGEVVYKRYVNLGIAAATPRGLVVPNVKDAQDLSLLDLARALNQLTDTAREGRTQPAEMSEGTFTITNVGVFGVDSGTPIINPGESAILCFGATRKQPWVVSDGGVDEIAVRQVTTLALSFDHRHIDGEMGSHYLSDVAGMIEDPATALLF